MYGRGRRIVSSKSEYWRQVIRAVEGIGLEENQLTSRERDALVLIIDYIRSGKDVHTSVNVSVICKELGIGKSNFDGLKQRLAGKGYIKSVEGGQGVVLAPVFLQPGEERMFVFYSEIVVGDGIGTGTN